MDVEPWEWRARYRLCQAGFSLLAVGLGLLCLAEVVQLLDVFGMARDIAQAQASPAWFWLVDAPIPWTTLIGSMLLVGQWKEPFWQGRALALALMNGVDAATWTLAHADRLGLTTGAGLGRYRWIVQVGTMGFGWFELLLTASLAAAVCAHLGSTEAQKRLPPARMVGTIGVSLWVIYALTQTNWTVWPVLARPLDRAGVLLLLASTALRAVACFQISLIGLTAARECRRYLVEWERHEAADPFQKHLDPDRDRIDPP